MKLYVADWGWKGSVSVVTYSRESATRLAEEGGCYVNQEDWEEHDFNQVVRTWGDQ